MTSRPKFRITSQNDKPARKTIKKSKKVLTGNASAMQNETDEMRLNKYISRSGICSRRDADELIKQGKVTVNGETVTEMGHKVLPTDTVIVNGATVKPENFVYVLLNKPSNTITTTDDNKGRNTVMDMVEEYTGHRLYPVGRLDRDTTGLLLLTNDGDLANRLMHPSYKVTKVYEAVLNKIIPDEAMDQLVSGVTLDDGPAKAVHIDRSEQFANGVVISVHDGRNHLVKRMFTAVGAEVLKLKRTEYAGFSLGKLRTGRWRYLKAFEVNKLRSSLKLPEMKFTKVKTEVKR